MDDSEELPTVLSLCTGYGGIERGLELAGFEHRTIAYVEIEAFAIANLVTKAQSGQLAPAPVWTDLKTLPVECFRDRVSVITGGYPCQPFSSAGKRAGKDDPRHLWPYIRDIIQAVRPVRVFFENVEGHISLGLSSVLSDLEEDGFRTTWGIFSAREVGAPHQRKRVYIMADSTSDDARTNLRNVESEDGTEGRPKVKKQKGSRQSRDSSEDVAHSDNGQRELQNKEIRAGRDTIIDGSYQLAYSESQRVQGLWASGQQEPCAHGQEKISMREGEGSREAQWPVEPGLGRVVDGCADRVDRIRLLGNGVVPQTAAKAWRVLNDRHR